MKTFFQSCGVILTLTAWAKFYSVNGSAGNLDLPDVLFGIPYHSLLLITGLLESAVVAFLLLSEDAVSKCACLLWLTLNLVLYRVGMFFLRPGTPCPCLGNLTDAIHISPRTADYAMKAVLGYLLIGSCATLLWLRRRAKVRPHHEL